MVYEAESKVKFVVIDPKRLIGKLNFCKKGTLGLPIKLIINEIFENHTAKANTKELVIKAKITYVGF